MNDLQLVVSFCIATASFSMNAMNRSGHSEMPDPDWYVRDADRAKVSPSTMDTDQSTVLNSSLASLNLDSFNFSDLNTTGNYSFRSLPVIPSSSDNNSIAYQPDAPWNQSPQSLRSLRGGGGRPRINARTILSITTPPKGVSAIDHLNNSISSLNLNGPIPPMQSIITEGVYELEDDSDSGEDASMTSLRVADFGIGINGSTPEMDATAHAGNVSRNINNHQYSSQFGSGVGPASPQRSTRQNNSYNFASPLASPQRSVRGPFERGSSSVAGSSITTRASVRFQQLNNASFGNYNNYSAQHEPSISTLGDDDQEDDDNMAIIKLLRTQVQTLKQQLLAEQKKTLLLQNECTTHPTDGFAADSTSDATAVKHDNSSKKLNISFSGSSAYSSAGDSFGCCDSSESASFGDESVASNLKDKKGDAIETVVSTAEEGVMGSIAALRQSLRAQQVKETSPSPTAPSVDINDDIDPSNSINRNDNFLSDEQLLLDELVLCELENHYRMLRQEQTRAQEELRETNTKLSQTADQQAARIAELERQLLQSQL